MTKKKWLNKIIIYFSFPFIAIIYKLLYLTYRLEIDKDTSAPLPPAQAILASFHQRFFPLISFLVKLRPTVMISQSNDGS